MLVVSEHVLKTSHLLCEFTGCPISKVLKVMNEMRLVCITKFVSQLRKVRLRLKHKAVSDSLKPDGSRQQLRGYPRCLANLSFQLANGHVAVIGHIRSYRMLGSFHDAEDVLQDSQLKAWQRLET